MARTKSPPTPTPTPTPAPPQEPEAPPGEPKFCCGFLVALALFGFGLGLFIGGFFPPKAAIPGFAAPISRLSLHPHNTTIEYPMPEFDRLVFLLIDALRADFVYNASSSQFLFAQQLISAGKAIPYAAAAHIPTVTLPRVKGLTSGSIPSFMDYVYNFNAKAFVEDNLIEQFRRAGKQIVMFGDDTWLKLFPHHFLRHDGTTSFFVSDTIEVDENVTRHLEEEFGREDWAVMVLHYLGLDHIGHSAGPQSPLMPHKQREMDNVLRRLYRYAEEKLQTSGERTLIVMLGDHGMNEAGNHGGSSELEKSTALFFASPSFALSEAHTVQQAMQIDLVPTLALLMGVPIPRNNLGSVLAPLFPSGERLLESLAFNAQQEWELMEGLGKSLAFDPQLAGHLRLAHDHHAAYLSHPTHEKSLRFQSAAEYYLFLQTLSQSFSFQLTEYNLHVLFTGIAALFQAFIAFGFFPLQPAPAVQLRKRLLRCLIWGVATLVVHGAVLFATGEAVGPFAWAWVVHALLSGIAAFFKFSLLDLVEAVVGWSSEVLFGGFREKGVDHGHVLASFLLIGKVLHLASLAASSFIEEEHQIGYFFATTVMIILIWTTWKSRTISWGLIVGLVCLRFGRAWNQTGNKWLGTPDIALYISQHPALMNSLMLLALAYFVWQYYLHFVVSRGFLLKSSVTIGALSLQPLACYKFGLGGPQISPVYLARTTYALWALSLAFALLHYLTSPRQPLNPRNSRWAVPYGGLLLATLCLLLHKPVNFALLPLLLTQLHSVVAMDPPIVMNGGLHWFAFQTLGQAWWFAFGNSNALSTIDISGAYTGLQQYQQESVALLVYIICYSGPLLVTAQSFVALLADTSSYDEMQQAMVAEGVHRSITAFVLCVVAVGMRYHLFVWSVFSPRLAYEVLHAIHFMVVVAAMALFQRRDRPRRLRA